VSAGYNAATAAWLIMQARATPDESIDVYQRLGGALEISRMLADQLESAMALMTTKRKPRAAQR